MARQDRAGQTQALGRLGMPAQRHAGLVPGQPECAVRGLVAQGSHQQRFGLGSIALHQPHPAQPTGGQRGDSTGRELAWPSPSPPSRCPGAPAPRTRPLSPRLAVTSG